MFFIFVKTGTDYEFLTSFSIINNVSCLKPALDIATWQLTICPESIFWSIIKPKLC